MTRVACCQLDPVIGEVDANTGLISSAISEAVSAGADIIVLPELATSGYMLADAE
ncbi:MAG TPA: nitrilase-related carbon-nitrogen hydrolase, partial [Mycobacterium sp.]|nr:nitrilase-related carbon-nitrogen hydrolase [Mycobacterium sp.]